MNYQRIYETILERRKSNIPTGYYEIHHILPRCLGGRNNKENLVKLTAKEHFICHLLLTKMYPIQSVEYYKMCKAFLMMQVLNKTGQRRYVTSRTYHKIKEACSKYMSVKQTGCNNNQFGKVWVYNKELRRSRLVPAGNPLEVGWEYGRKPRDTLRICKACNLQFSIKFGARTICDRCRLAHRVNSAKRMSTAKECSIDGEIYPSVRVAAEALGMKSNTVQFRINSKNFKSYFYTSADAKC